ncbi:Sugar transferase [Rubrivivax sp. A210]|uniref:TIGR03087 family PEP-CTERM/XrtA system glycosyltransferase n=1 Tax=Rubrivivax sp. A210 TaxID=2772301 RepID=UPI001917A36B|nr:TIGR03087 family PEP-CTERM/XrtA system glycosyltransferase [Rubrivivax sp. A210]CAD5375210.1 Sugar transferase [Rubrivivax sp. A210]
MADLLYLVHRLPYPPNKGDKVRSFHLLQHLLARHRVHLGTFVDDPADEAHLPHLQGLCASLHAERLHPLRARLASLAGLARGDALTLHYYRSAALARWVDETVAREPIAATVVFSSSMAQYAQRHPQIPMLVDFVDVDSAKWTDYAPNHRWPMSWLYRREGRRLLECESEVARQAQASYFATEKEVDLFRRLAPAAGRGVQAMNNGVDARYFSPAPERASPFEKDEAPLVFTGAMDYWPNVDAVNWFAQDVLPRLRQARPGLRLHIVGRSPAPAVRALAGPGVVVTGTVPDVRPYLQHAAVVVAPLRLARGIQNKILEAMAMARPVVAATACVQALQAEEGAEVLAAEAADDYVRILEQLLAAPERAAAIGAAGRRRVLQTYDWSTHMAVVERQLAALGAAVAA